MKEKEIKANKLREMSDDQLEAVLNDAKDHLFRLRVQAGTEKLDATSELRKQRRLIARAKTILAERTKTAQE
jgi:large subunit ribosomal protein L29